MNFFSLKLHNTTIRKEVLSGISTFIAMSYILSINPVILSSAGMDPGGVFIATVVSIIITTLVGAFYTKMPLAYAPSLSLNMMFLTMTNNICGGDYRMVLLATYLSGIVIVVVVITGAYDQIVIRIPSFVKHSIIAGIGLIILLAGTNVLQLFLLDQNGKLHSAKILSKEILFGLLVIGIVQFLRKKKRQGAIAIGILVTYALAALSELITYLQSPAGGVKSFISNYISSSISVKRILEVAYQFPHIEELINDRTMFLKLIMMVFTITLIHFFDAFGTTTAELEKIQMDDENYDQKAKRKTMMVNGIGSLLSGCAGTSSVSTNAENMIGIDGGAKTGLSAIVVCICCLLSLFFSPVFIAMSGYIVAPVMIYIGILFLSNVRQLKGMRRSEAIPFIFIVIYSGVTFQVGEAVSFGILINMILKILLGRKKEITSYWPMIVIFCIICIAIRIAN
ncbi:MAG: NCS2 family permease [bacterium]|nr:NCS2 family permease [bacterium]